jgi:hypothetical protein
VLISRALTTGNAILETGYDVRALRVHFRVPGLELREGDAELGVDSRA